MRKYCTSVRRPKKEAGPTDGLTVRAALPTVNETTVVVVSVQCML